jgi:hypothetical protein
MNGSVHLDDEVLSALVDGELSNVEADSALRHESTCETCQARVAALRQVAQVVSAGAVGHGTRSGADLVDFIVAAALTEADRVAAEVSGPDLAEVLPLSATPRRRRHLVLRAALSAAAVVAGVGIALAAFAHPAPPPRGAAAASGLPSSLGSYDNAATLGPTLETEIASLAAGSGQDLPCRFKAATIVGAPAGTVAVFSAPLTYNGAPAQVFAYRKPLTSAGRIGGQSVETGGSGGAGASQSQSVAVVVTDGNCTLVARLGW